jgi:hypothetical protein
LAAWGKRLLGRKGQINLVAAAVARKLTVAVWYLLMGRWTPVQEIDPRLDLKIGKIIGQLGPKRLETLLAGRERQTLRQEIQQRLKTGRVYALDPDKKFTPQAAAC